MKPFSSLLNMLMGARSARGSDEIEVANRMLADYRRQARVRRPEVTEKMKRAAALKAFGYTHVSPELFDEYAKLVDDLASLVP